MRREAMEQFAPHNKASLVDAPDPRRNVEHRVRGPVTAHRTLLIHAVAVHKSGILAGRGFEHDPAEVRHVERVVRRKAEPVSANIVLYHACRLVATRGSTQACSGATDGIS